MARYKVFVGQRTYDIRIEKNHLLVNGDRFKFDMESLNGNGLHVLRHPNQHIEAYLEPKRHGSYEVQIEGQHVNAQVDFAHRARKGQQAAAAGDLMSQMPGLIVDILASEGDQVEEGETLLVQEAMKMQMKLRAPCSGIVQTITVKKGNEVDKNVLLAAIEPNGVSS